MAQSRLCYNSVDHLREESVKCTKPVIKSKNTSIGRLSLIAKTNMIPIHQILTARNSRDIPVTLSEIKGIIRVSMLCAS